MPEVNDSKIDKLLSKMDSEELEILTSKARTAAKERKREEIKKQEASAGKLIRKFKDEIYTCDKLPSQLRNNIAEIFGDTTAV